MDKGHIFTPTGNRGTSSFMWNEDAKATTVVEKTPPCLAGLLNFSY